jgi:hypothetical protein
VQVFFAVMGQHVDGRRSAQTLAMLDDVAHALSNIVPIYAPESATHFKALAPLDLLDGKFEGGGMIFRTKNGTQVTRLTVQRKDMKLAISVLRAAKARFGRRPDAHL